MQASYDGFVPAPARRQIGGGFTLIELIMVMSLIAIMLYIIAPSLTGFTKSRRTNDTATLLLALANYGRTHAMSEGRNYRLVFDLEHRQFQLESQDGATYSPVDNDFGLLHDLPDGVDVDVQIQPQLDTLPEFGQDAQGNGSTPDGGTASLSSAQTEQPPVARDGMYIEFRSSGRTDQSVIQVLNTAGGSGGYILRCPSETEGFEIVSPSGAK
jgi:prepilin-type N-terminal cleavage/methylation domain-containing protein